jgi:hypothetical protein
MSPSDTGDTGGEPNAYAITLDELEHSVHVAPEDIIVEVPGQAAGRYPGDDDLSRQQAETMRTFG